MLKEENSVLKSPQRQVLTETCEIPAAVCDLSFSTKVERARLL